LAPWRYLGFLGSGTKSPFPPSLQECFLSKGSQEGKSTKTASEYIYNYFKKILWFSRTSDASDASSELDMEPSRKLYDGGFMVVLQDPNDHSQILPISHMRVYLISDDLLWAFL